MKQSIIAILGLAILAACGGDENKNTTASSTTASAEKTADGNPSYDPKRGEGKFSNVELSPTLDVAKATAGQKVYEVKCSGCHKLTDERLVGPGWQGVSTRHKPEWLLNFFTNTEAMIDKDPKLQAQLEICLVRMPNQNLSDDEAYQLLEFIRKNDGIK